MHKITKSIFSLYDSLIKKLYDSQKDLSINLIGVNIIDESCLDFIYHHGALTPSEIAVKLNVTTSAVTQMLQKYDQLKLIKKTRQRFLEGLKTLRKHGTLFTSCFLNARY